MKSLIQQEYAEDQVLRKRNEKIYFLPEDMYKMFTYHTKLKFSNVLWTHYDILSVLNLGKVYYSDL